MDEIRPTGAYRAWGWSLLGVGIATLLVVWPLFAFGSATQGVGDALTGTEHGVDVVTVMAWFAPLAGLTLIGGAVALLVIASKRAAANREAAQRAVLYSSRSTR